MRETLSADLLDLRRGSAGIEDRLSGAVGKGVIRLVVHLVQLDLRPAAVLRMPLGHAGTLLALSFPCGLELLSDPGGGFLILPRERRDPLLKLEVLLCLVDVCDNTVLPHQRALSPQSHQRFVIVFFLISVAIVGRQSSLRHQPLQVFELLFTGSHWYLSTLRLMVEGVRR